METVLYIILVLIGIVIAKYIIYAILWVVGKILGCFASACLEMFVFLLVLIVIVEILSVMFP